MLIYSKVVDGKRKLFYSVSGIPAYNDSELTYKDDSGDAVDVSELCFFYNKNGVMGGKSTNQVPAEDDVIINVYAGDTCIIGKDLNMKISVNSIDNVDVSFTPDAVSEYQLAGSSVSIEVAPAAGYELSNVSVSYDSKSVELQEVSGKYAGTFQLVYGKEAVSVSATASPVE